MSSKILLRISAIIIFIHMLGHTMGHLGWDKPEDRGLQEVVKTMKAHKAEFMGATKSMADYFQGYSLILFGVFASGILIIWFVSGFAAENRIIAQKIIVPLSLSYLFYGCMEYIYFFPFAAAISILAGALALISVTFVKK